MVEVKVDGTAVVATHSASTARIRHEDATHFLLAASHGVANASFASPAAACTHPTRIERMLGQTVPPAHAQLDGTSAIRGGRPTDLLD